MKDIINQKSFENQDIYKTFIKNIRRTGDFIKLPNVIVTVSSYIETTKTGYFFLQELNLNNYQKFSKLISHYLKLLKLVKRLPS